MKRMIFSALIIHTNKNTFLFASLNFQFNVMDLVASVFLNCIFPTRVRHIKNKDWTLIKYENGNLIFGYFLSFHFTVSVGWSTVPNTLRNIQQP